MLSSRCQPERASSTTDGVDSIRTMETPMRRSRFYKTTVTESSAIVRYFTPALASLRLTDHIDILRQILVDHQGSMAAGEVAQFECGPSQFWLDE